MVSKKLSQNLSHFGDFRRDKKNLDFFSGEKILFWMLFFIMIPVKVAGVSGSITFVPLLAVQPFIPTGALSSLREEEEINIIMRYAVAWKAPIASQSTVAIC